MKSTYIGHIFMNAAGIFGDFSESCNIGQIVLWNIFLALISTKKSRFGRSRFHFVGTFLVIFSAVAPILRPMIT